MRSRPRSPLVSAHYNHSFAQPGHFIAEWFLATSAKRPLRPRVRPRAKQPAAPLLQAPAKQPVGPLLVIAVVAAALGIRFFRFISQYSVNVLFYDQWDFFGSFFRGKPTFAELFFWQHGPHREGVGLVADWFLYPATHWNVRAESFLIGACIFIAMILALWIKRKLFGAFGYSDVAIPLIFLTLAQYETLIGTPNAAYAGFPLLLIMLYSLALLVPRAPLRYGLVLLANFLLIYTGFGLFMGAVTLGYFALECYRSLRRISPVRPLLPIGGLLLAAASLGSFFLNYTFSPAVDCFTPPGRDVLPYGRFMALMFANFFGLKMSVEDLTLLGAATLLLAVGVMALQAINLLRGGGSGNTPVIIAALLGYTLLFSANTAVGRLCLGLPLAAQVSRYATLLIPGYLAFYFFLQSIRFALPRAAGSLLLIALFYADIGSAPQDHWSSIRWYANGKRAWVACYKQTGDIAHCDQATHFPIYPHPANTGLAAKLEYLKQHHLNLFADDN